MKTNPNDPANALMPSHTDPASIKGTWFQGLTKREDFAKAAMIGLLAAVDIKNFDSKDLTDASVRIADELIRALNKEEQ